MLTPFTDYTASIAASTAIGVGPQSTQISFTTSEDVPSGPPLNPSATVIDSRTALLTWDEPLEEHRNGIIRQYHVNVTDSEEDSVNERQSLLLASTTNSLSVSSLRPYRTYQWAVSAFTIGLGPFTAPQTITTPEDAPSGAPQMLTTVNTEVSTISLAWQLPLPEDRNGIVLGFSVQVTSISSRADTTMITTPYTNITVTSLAPYTVYECIVAAYTRIGTGPSSNTVLARTEPTNPSGTPSNTTGVALNSTHIHIDWEPLPVEQQHGVLQEYRITVAEIETSTVFTVSSDPELTEAIIGPLHPYYTYNCTILAVTVGEGPPSTVVTVRTEEDAPSGPPTNFTLTSISSTSMHLAWQPPLPQQWNGIIRQYVVYVQPLFRETLTYTIGNTNYTVSGLSPFTNYSFSVAAITIQTGPASEQILAQTFSAAPSGPPQSVRAQATGPTRLTLSWDLPLEELRNGIIQRYSIRITELETRQVINHTTGDTSINVTALHPYYTYNCTVAAETFAAGPFSSPVVIRLPEDAPSSPPLNLMHSEVTSTGFTLSWNAPPIEDHNGVIRHYVIQCTELRSGDVAIHTTTDSTAQIMLDSLNPFHNYICAVAAATISEGPFSPSITIRTTEDAPSAAPDQLTVISQSSTEVTLSWALPPEAGRNGLITGYSVNVTNNATGEVEIHSTTMTRLSVPSLRPYTTYICSVAAQTSVGLGPYTSITVTTNESAPIGPPISLMVVSTTSTSATLSWSSPPEQHLNGILRHYVIIIEEVDSRQSANQTSTQSRVVLRDLHPYYTYNFAVCAVTVDIGPCEYYEPLQLPQDVPTGAPQGISATTPSSSSVLLSWDPPSVDQRNGLITTYHINMTEIETGTRLELVVENAIQLLVGDLHPYYVYNFLVSAATNVGQGPYSPVFAVQTPEDVPSSPPRNAVGRVDGSMALSITWQPPAADGQNGVITGYAVLLLEQPTNATFEHRRSGLHTEISITNLHPYYEYRCSVAAETSVGRGPFTAPFILTTDQHAPSVPPRNVSSKARNSTNVQLTWLPPELSGQNGIIQHYIISTIEVDTSRQFQTTSSLTFATAMDLHPYYTYTFAIAAVTVGRGPYSEEVSVQTLEDAPSGPPQSFRVVAISSTSIRLSWLAPREEQQNGVITSYRINLTDTEGRQVSQRTTSANDLVLIIDSLLPYHTYQCTIAAFTVAIGPETSAQVTTFQEVPNGTPRNATAIVLDSSRVDCRWLPPLPEEVNGIIIGYTVHITGQDNSEILELQTNATSIRVRELHPFYSYVFTAAAITNAGQGPFSPAVYFQMLSAAPEGVISNVTTVIVSKTSVSLHWYPVDPNFWNGIITSYTVEYERQEPVEFNGVTEEPHVTLTASIPSLPEHPLTNSPDPRFVSLPLREESLRLDQLEENYVYQVVIYFENSAGKSGESSPVRLEMPSSAPSGPPVNVTVQAISSSSLFISWQPPEQLHQNGIIAGYRIQIGHVDGLSTREYTLTADVNSYRVTDLEKYSTYEVAIAASTSEGFGPYSSPVEQKTLEDVPEAPMNLKVTLIDDSTAEVSWLPPSSPNGVILDYELCYGTKGSKDDKLLMSCQNVSSSNKKLVTKLISGSIYEFKVRARTIKGYGSPVSFNITLSLSTVTGGVVSETSAGGSSATVGAVFAALGFLTLIIVLLVVVSGAVLYYRQHKKKQREPTIAIDNMVIFNSTTEEETDADSIQKVDLSDERVAYL